MLAVGRNEHSTHTHFTAEDAMLRRVRLQAQRAADLIDRLPSKCRSTKAARSIWLSDRHRPAHPVLHLGAQHQPLRRGSSGIRGSTPRRTARDPPIVRRLPGAAAPDQIDRAVHRDPMQPGAEVRARLEPAELLVGPQKVSWTTSSASEGLPVIRCASRRQRGYGAPRAPEKPRCLRRGPARRRRRPFAASDWLDGGWGLRLAGVRSGEETTGRGQRPPAASCRPGPDSSGVTPTEGPTV